MANDLEKVMKSIEMLEKSIENKINKIPKVNLAEIQSSIANNRKLLGRISAKLNEISGTLESISTAETSTATASSITVPEFEG
ncbi:MAG TPA: hypothetical protein ENH49_05480 [Candidatus Marinimicrobia bacterium]|nr:hypothetical protein [Candidatus Neomarinimicrobiota bacterium]